MRSLDQVSCACSQLRLAAIIHLLYCTSRPNHNDEASSHLEQPFRVLSSCQRRRKKRMTSRYIWRRLQAESRSKARKGELSSADHGRQHDLSAGVRFLTLHHGAKGSPTSSCIQTQDVLSPTFIQMSSFPLLEIQLARGFKLLLQCWPKLVCLSVVEASWSEGNHSRNREGSEDFVGVGLGRLLHSRFSAMLRLARSIGLAETCAHDQSVQLPFVSPFVQCFPPSVPCR